MQDLTTDLTVTGVLEPLTSVTGSLRIIRPTMVQSVERLVHQFCGSDVLRNWKVDGGRSGCNFNFVSDEVKSKIRGVAGNTVREQCRGQRSRRRASARGKRQNGMYDISDLKNKLKCNDILFSELYYLVFS